MKNLISRIIYVFRDSYGLDKLSKYLIFLGVILGTNRYTAILGLGIIVVAVWRIFSKNKFKRSQEDALFEKNLLLLKQKLFRSTTQVRESRKYKIFSCPNCAQKLRVPRKKGKLLITCKKCGTEFKGKS